jgi:hypothetical protein
MHTKAFANPIPLAAAGGHGEARQTPNNGEVGGV